MCRHTPNKFNIFEIGNKNLNLQLQICVLYSGTCQVI